jgi:hypothetical protein
MCIFEYKNYKSNFKYTHLYTNNFFFFSNYSMLLDNIARAYMTNRQSGKSETKVNQAMQPTDEKQVMTLYIINERTHLSLFHLNKIQLDLGGVGERQLTTIPMFQGPFHQNIHQKIKIKHL